MTLKDGQTKSPSRLAWPVAILPVLSPLRAGQTIADLSQPPKSPVPRRAAPISAARDKRRTGHAL